MIAGQMKSVGDAFTSPVEHAMWLADVEFEPLVGGSVHPLCLGQDRSRG